MGARLPQRSALGSKQLVQIVGKPEPGRIGVDDVGNRASASWVPHQLKAQLLQRLNGSVGQTRLHSHQGFHPTASESDAANNLRAHG